MEPKWLDAPFFDMLTDFSSLQTYFMTQAIFIAKIVITLNLGFIVIKYVAKGSGLSEQLIKLASSLIIFFIIVSSYPLMITGINQVIYSWGYGSTYPKVAAMIQKTTSDGTASDFWAKKSDPNSDQFSDIIKVLEEKTGSGNIAKKYVLDIFDKGTPTRPGMFIRPNAVMRLLMLTFETIWDKALKCTLPTGTLPFPHDLGGFVILAITAFAVVFCGIMAALQYFICALEFTLITSIGCLMLPFMLWDGTKFLTEKLVGAIVGFSLKMLFITIGLMLTINGYLALMVRPFDSYIDQSIYTIFVSLFYMMICQNGPALAVSLLTGTPQMSLMEGVQSAGAFAAAGIAGAAGVKAAGSTAAKTGVQMKSAVDKASGAAAAAKASGKSQVGAVLGSVKDSAVDSAKSGLHGLSQSLTRGAGGSSGGSGSAGKGGESKPTDGLHNRYSNMERRNAKNENGNKKTGKEFGAESKQMGRDRYMEKQQTKSETANQKAAADWKSQISNKPKPQESQKRYEGGTPLGQNIPTRQTGKQQSNGGEDNGKSS
jgi:type IV secretion system protein TrbL